ncbi:hypothetical protein PanWU01x14_115690, partial [Parasponia andersonii]
MVKIAFFRLSVTLAATKLQLVAAGSTRSGRYTVVQVDNMRRVINRVYPLFAIFGRRRK